MRSNYKPIGDYIHLVDERNKDLKVTRLLGLSISKEFIRSVANTVGTDMRNYKIIRKNQFACSTMQVRRDRKMPVALLTDFDEAIISQAYPIFEIHDKNQILPEYLMMWFSRAEFDRHAEFLAVGGVRGTLEWEDFLAMELPVPSIEKQQEIVKEFNVVKNRIALNEQLNRNLEETAQALYKLWFVDFEFPVSKESHPKLVSGSQPLGYKSAGGKMVFNEELDKEIPVGWSNGKFQDHVNIKMGQSPKGSTYNQNGNGTPLINGPVEFGNFFTEKRKWTSAPTKLCEKGDLIICVRGSTVGRFVKSDGIYCLGRGVCSFKAIHSQRFVDELYKYSLEELLSYTTGSTFPNLDGQTLLNFSSIIPTIEIVRLFNKVVNTLYLIVESKAREIVCLNEFQTLLLSKMATVGSEEEIISY